MHQVLADWLPLCGAVVTFGAPARDRLQRQISILWRPSRIVGLP